MKSFTSRIGLGSKKTTEPAKPAAKAPAPAAAKVQAKLPTVAAPSGSDKPEPQKWIVGKQYPVIPGELFYMSIRNEEKLRELQDWQKANGVNVDRIFFTGGDELQYFPFCADFGPMNFGMTYRFCKMLNAKIEQAKRQGKKVVYYSSADPAERTNAVTLICSYLVLDRGWTAEDAIAPLTFAGRQPFLPYRDASFQPVVFELSILDILRGIHKGLHLGLIDMAKFDLEFYEYCDHPSMADLHVIVPDKFVAMKGPHSKSYFKDGVQFLAPSHYFEIFKKLGVSAVVRLNDEQYSAKTFQDAGFNHYTIYFDDCTVPDMSVVTQWFEACRKEKGALAVHCKAGLGRTGTLICLWMMRKWKFTGREAIGYLRVMRPGSILGPQQEYLTSMEEKMWEMGDPDIEPSKAQASRAAGGTTAMSAEAEAREKEAARKRAQENTDAMNRRAANMAARGGGR
eukprot:CAMPEP_0181318240 /NCGR_PEP_ID=MMETSP1101-20121128/16902_1 /TAXON_ID=46948 /ORGANISM="Rhodomonas abbreviata, Strain Caron Lab Isolate" /LENGTH=453 /DNA_ID=CAMNT_0023425699 /DNA_START=239 /DNA_END=1600 /DNA_ORIENTATION=-